MRTFTAPLHELGEFEEIERYLREMGRAVALTGCVDSQKLHMIYGLSNSLGFKYKIIVAASDLRAREIFEDYQLYDRNVTLYPAKDLICSIWHTLKNLECCGLFTFPFQSE